MDSAASSHGTVYPWQGQKKALVAGRGVLLPWLQGTVQRALLPTHFQVYFGKLKGLETGRGGVLGEGADGAHEWLP